MTGSPSPIDELSDEASARILATLQREMTMRRSEARTRAARFGAGTLVGVMLLAGVGYGVVQSRGTPRLKTDLTESTSSSTADSTVATVTVRAEPKNFLLVGAERAPCLEPVPSEAADGESERADTIMVVRVAPTGPPVIVSFPRDLWLKIPNTNASGRISSMYKSSDPSRLIAALEENFNFRVDHYVEVDFCGFRELVDAIGGVKVPFAFPAFDRRTGLNIPNSGCFKLDGHDALAYVRSRYYQWYDGTQWHDDTLGDVSRIARQQDFVKRLVATAFDRGVSNPLTATELLNAAMQHVLVDDAITPNQLVELASTLRRSDAEGALTFSIEMLVGLERSPPNLTSATNQAVLAVLRGEAEPDELVQGGPNPVVATGDGGTATPGYLPPNDPSCR
jgi:LCP family protein required for cell wall assembly